MNYKSCPFFALMPSPHIHLCDSLGGFNLSTMLGCQVSALTHRSIHHQKSSSDSPLHANTGIPEIKSRWRLKEKARKHKKKTKTDASGWTDGRTLFSQSSSHSILGGEDVTGRPATLSPQHRQSLNQHLQETQTKHMLTIYHIYMYIYACMCVYIYVVIYIFYKCIISNADERMIMQFIITHPFASLWGVCVCWTDRCLCCDVCAAQHFGSSQRFLPTCSFPQDHQRWHF